MYLKALEIQGFKSFPDKTVLNFGEDITAIVGPNGSGKSNISDAIRWVMGEQSSKSLRGVKMEDVIFGGTETRNQMGFAQVTLVLDNTEHIFPSMEENEVAVTRRYYRSGESEYYINKQSVRLRDVNELFMDTGMGREGYSIIGQGRIDEILSQKSGDRREIFEEAAGISRFRYRKEETERKLERTEENLVRINDKIAELELQVEPLRAQAETAKQYLIYRDELRLLEISVWLENLETLKTNAIKLDTDLSLAREELKKANADLEALYAASEQFSARIHENDIAQEEKRAQLSELDAQVKEQESAVAVLQTGIAHNEENIARVEEELRSQSDRVGSMDEQIAQQRARIEELEIKTKSKRRSLRCSSRRRNCRKTRARPRARPRPCALAKRLPCPPRRTAARKLPPCARRFLKWTSARAPSPPSRRAGKPSFPTRAKAPRRTAARSKVRRRKPTPSATSSPATR